MGKAIGQKGREPVMKKDSASFVCQSVEYLYNKNIKFHKVSEKISEIHLSFTTGRAGQGGNYERR
jgi:hypothetical protein